MTNAANNLRATSYVDRAELAALQSTGAIPANVIPANLGDTAGTLLGIFNGPFGGTLGVPNNVSLSNANNPTVQPPLMNWSGGTTLSSATASTTPQEFFLGSLNTAGTPPTQSIGNRWAQLPYPNIRFGYKQPGNLFVARRVWWCIPVVYQPAQPNAEYQAITDPASVNSYQIAQANYVLSVYEIPSQLPISGNANLMIGADTSLTPWGSNISVTGSISGNRITLSGGSYSGVSSRQQVQVVNPATVGGVAYSVDNTGSAFDQPGTREQMAAAPTQTPGAAAPVSVAGNDGKALLVPVMPGSDFYIPAPGAPTHWDLYARPYYRCRIRVMINTDSTTGAFTGVQIIYLPDTSSKPDQIIGFPDSAATKTQPIPLTSLASYGMNYTNTATGGNILVIDVPNMVSALGTPASLYSIYVGPNPSNIGSNPSIGVAITDTNDLSAFTSGLSIVTNQTLYLLDSFNQGKNDTKTGLLIPGSVVPTSLYAPLVVCGGNSATNPQVNLTGQGGIVSQVAVVATPGSTPVNPLNFTNVNGNPIGLSNTNATLTEVTNPTQIPPITALNLLFTIEKEH
jgi:hypothetical protein